MVKALIVDDEEVVRSGLKKYISWNRVGIHKVCTADSTEKALELAEADKPDIVISDIRMPRMDGIELCRHIKSFNEYCRIIFLSGYADKEYLKGAIHLSAEDYMEKPVDIQAMEECLQRAVEKCRKYREVIEKERELELYRRTGDKQLREEMLNNRITAKWKEDTAELLKRADYHETVLRIVEYVRNHFMEEDMSIKQIADAVYISPTYLTSFFKNKTGKTIGQYIKDIRMEYALQLIEQKHYTVVEIAEKCGYADANYFAKVFKKENGVSPSEYRERQKK